MPHDDQMAFFRHPRMDDLFGSPCHYPDFLRVWRYRVRLVVLRVVHRPLLMSPLTPLAVLLLDPRRPVSVVWSPLGLRHHGLLRVMWLDGDLRLPIGQLI